RPKPWPISRLRWKPAWNCWKRVLLLLSRTSVPMSRPGWVKWVGMSWKGRAKLWNCAVTMRGMGGSGQMMRMVVSVGAGDWAMPLPMVRTRIHARRNAALQVERCAGANAWDRASRKVAVLKPGIFGEWRTGADAFDGTGKNAAVRKMGILGFMAGYGNRGP